MRPLIVLAGAMCVGLAACSAGGGGTGATSPASQFEAVTVSGSQSEGDDFVKMNTATGEAWFHCCGTANSNFSSVRDDTSPPAGDYHLIRWNQVDAQGDVNWNVYRFDRKTGHTWALQSSDKGGNRWMDINSNGK